MYVWKNWQSILVIQATLEIKSLFLPGKEKSIGIGKQLNWNGLDVV